MTWRSGLVALGLLGTVAIGTRGLWVPAVGRSLICPEDLGLSDVTVVDNSDQSYLVFERAAALQKAGLTGRIAVPTRADARDAASPDLVSKEIVGVMTRVSRLLNVDIIPVVEREPITINVARQVADYARTHHARSMTVVVSGFRSRRTLLIYRAVMEPAGVAVRCVPVTGEAEASNWTRGAHGVQNVVEQFLKLQYYRMFVLPFAARPDVAPVASG